MTAEVAVMNRMGVALAADSAVTIGSSANKIYTSAEKLFQLSECAPVGVMIYGNAGYVSLPWETIIKTFRRQLGRTTYTTVQRYSDEFTAFLRDNPRLFPEENRLHVMEKLAFSLFVEVRRRRAAALEEKWDGLPEDAPPLTPVEIGATFLEAIDGMVKMFEDVERIEGYDAISHHSIKSYVDKKIAIWAKDAFDFTMPDGGVERLADATVEYLTRQTLQDYTSGIVIAGFGEEEFMPSLATFEVEECAGILPRRKSGQTIRITHMMPSYVMPYAQRDSVFHFLLGVDSELSDFMEESVRVMGNGLIDTILDKVGEANADLASALRGPAKEIVSNELKQLFGAWEQQQKDYLKPVRNTVSVLPKDELAAMAEAFVNLTKFRRRVTPVPETVSGPIDVAVITK